MYADFFAAGDTVIAATRTGGGGGVAVAGSSEGRGREVDGVDLEQQGVQVLPDVLRREGAHKRGGGGGRRTRQRRSIALAAGLSCRDGKLFSAVAVAVAVVVAVVITCSAVGSGFWR